jgi:hypothetical protein
MDTSRATHAPELRYNPYWSCIDAIPPPLPLDSKDNLTFYQYIRLTCKVAELHNRNNFYCVKADFLSHNTRSHARLKKLARKLLIKYY